MSLPSNTQQSLRRLKELEKLAQADAHPRRTWKDYVKLKSDNLFLLTLITTLVCLGCLMVMFMHDAESRERMAKERDKYASEEAVALATREIPLGKFESISQSAADQGNVSVLQYEAFITTGSSIVELQEAENAIRSHKQRLRATVELVMNKATDSELKEPSLGVVRGQLVEKLNGVVGDQMVQDVQFANFLHFQVPDTK
ncbi:MAG: hypothetical protein ACE37I_01905 [Rubinisphaera brasiliensis]|uniref:Uncharacterized protein n=1 Tax=Rubinisphaera brasiliensis (strain ATCC 49424 / DSM 5305 / JCM 21570 / IAM 15109 / NBRC 103401 / IFAM 1448) TaxID=756272 RepID=F0SQY4_RUBBR|nr:MULTISPECIES: hypothetical protein [Rubinisphaera]ADY60205.1 hypothetical protein Plabr_2605 [Rubinisphaera brasiliensis DSM 5305]MBB01581.1 hypothetical protein [Planctomyces sp.]MBR9801420.1 hypothetical protein [bacterium]